MIEKIFHQIWINNKNPELPDDLKKLRDTWLAHHPTWEYRLWNLANLDFEPRCAPLLPKCQHPAQIADLLRMEILCQHGGVYLDTDFECLRPIDEIIEDVFEFGCSDDGRCLSIAILGAQKGSHLFNAVVDNFPKKVGERPVNIETGPAFFTEVLLKKGFNNNFTVFPSHFFYPFNYHTPDRSSVDLSHSYAVHHYADSWKSPVPAWRKFLSRVKRAL